MGETLISIQVLCYSFVAGCDNHEAEWPGKNPKTSFITKHFNIFSFSLEHVTALPQIFLVAMGKKSYLMHEVL